MLHAAIINSRHTQAAANDVCPSPDPCCGNGMNLGRQNRSQCRGWSGAYWSGHDQAAA